MAICEAAGPTAMVCSFTVDCFGHGIACGILERIAVGIQFRLVVAHASISGTVW